MLLWDKGFRACRGVCCQNNKGNKLWIQHSEKEMKKIIEGIVVEQCPPGVARGAIDTFVDKAFPSWPYLCVGWGGKAHEMRNIKHKRKK